MELSEIPFLDRWLAEQEAATWLGIPERELAEKRRKGEVPAGKFGPRTFRYNPRTVIEFFKPAQSK